MTYKLTDFNIIYRQKLNSTNSFAKDLINENNFQLPMIIYADFQSSGKGQGIKIWESNPAENILMSLVFSDEKILASEQFFISKALCIAIIDEISRLIENSEFLSIKWPNDIYWKEKKLGGILVENSIIGNKLNHSICGLGLNINQTQFSSVIPNPISLANITNNNFEILPLVKNISVRFMNYINEFDQNKIDKEYLEKLFLKDVERNFKIKGENRSLKISNVDKYGRLILLDNKTKIVCNHGEVDFNL
jgi:BirA family biotin operon repressor/biotin-[acetyl-CoA-carboxylase] ligase